MQGFSYWTVFTIDFLDSPLEPTTFLFAHCSTTHFTSVSAVMTDKKATKIETENFEQTLVYRCTPKFVRIVLLFLICCLKARFATTDSTPFFPDVRSFDGREICAFRFASTLSSLFTSRRCLLTRAQKLSLKAKKVRALFTL